MVQDNKHERIAIDKKSSAIQQLSEPVVEDVQTDSESKEASLHHKEETESAPAPPYSTFTNAQKIGITLTVSFLALISPLSGQVYLPALDPIAQDLHVPISYINLTITTFMVRA